MEQDLNTSNYTFEDMINGNVLYVDKTEYIWKLIRPAKGLYFLSRPRRFGKSLLISTLKAITAHTDDWRELQLRKRTY